MISYIDPITNDPLDYSIDKLYYKQNVYHIVNSIPRFVPSDNYAEAFGLQWNTYKKTQLDSFTGYNFTQRRLERCLGTSIFNLKDKNVLEAGCGPGRFSELFIKGGANTHSFDLSNAVDANIENVGIHTNYQLAQADIYKIPYPDEVFDYVCCLGVIQHTPSPEKTIESLWKKVKPGGVLVIDHYKWRWAYYSTLKPFYRFFLKRLKPHTAKKIIDKMVDFFFPIQWEIRNVKWLHRFFNRFTPLIVYYYEHPELSKEAHLEWAKMDTMDSTTDFYKHLRTPNQIYNILKELGAKDIWIHEGGNGVEARCIK
jgi:2-polyprenyl-3-methyl-5-hydroxy-6-metoxy-1,4-benzoquinol methylase